MGGRCRGGDCSGSMLVARHQDQRIDAFVAEKGPNYVCPNCGSEVVLKKGKIVIHHFAHKPPTHCAWANGETRKHLLAKTVLRDAFRERGYKSEFEVEVLSGAGDRRADVLVTDAMGKSVAIEIQHTPILNDAIECRTTSYVVALTPVIWIGILSNSMKQDAIQMNDTLVIEQYVIRPWEKWAHAYYFKELWYIDPIAKELWKGRFSDYFIEVESSSWYNEYGEEQSAGGYSRISKKWKTLTLAGPTPLDIVNIETRSRKAWQSKAFCLPSGRYAHFTFPVPENP
jgi:ssDNA-binding Zn-finger/Zn-ribbon topoisomerase 1